MLETGMTGRSQGKQHKKKIPNKVTKYSIPEERRGRLVERWGSQKVVDDQMKALMVSREKEKRGQANSGSFVN